MRRLGSAGKRDANQSVIVAALRATGWYTLSLGGVGFGCPDILAAKNGRLELIEVKDGSQIPSRRKLTEDEAKVHLAFAQAGVEVRIVESVEQAVNL